MHAKLDNIAIVLKGPKFAGNVGSVARCAKNMGIAKLIVVGNRELDDEEMRKMATHVAGDIVDDIRHYDTLDEALAEFNWVVGTTARQGWGRGPVVSPRQMAEQIVNASQENRVALLFGPEDAGLTNDDLRFCQTLVSIPTAGFKSLNLSQAAMVVCYEIFVAHREETAGFKQKLAEARELDGMYAHLQATLSAIGFLLPENPDYWMTHIRRLFSRTTLLAREVKIIRGICRQIEWYGDHKERKTP
ncbi:MAG: RNA methyltransferase [Syntrophobacterales bacterium]|nr:RNA methyltransferase [Syntrophobacterales bacterium]